MNQLLPRLVLLSAFALVAAPVHAANETPPKALFESEAEAKGDFDAWVTELTDALVSDSSSPYAVLLIDRIRGLLTYSTDQDAIDAKLEEALAAGVSDPEIREKLQDFVAARRRAGGDFFSRLFV